MKIFPLLILLTLSTLFSFGQVQCDGIAMLEYLYFDGGSNPLDYSLQIDTVSNPNNIWHVGAPQKNVINSAYSLPNVIITDTINSYPTNDTSVFIIKQIDQGGYSIWQAAELAGYYKVNSDSLHDFGTIEISLDQGTTWINLVTDTTYSSYYNWLTPKPTLTGNSNGWQNFWIFLAPLGQVFNVNMGDTIFIRFTFISDSIADNLDGLAYDNFQYCNGAEGIEERLNENFLVIYPNPATDILSINRRTKSEKESVKIFSYTGQLLYENNDFKTKSIDLKKLNLAPGLYFLKYSDMKDYALRQFIVQH
jgi:hypothetical protein